ncbi:MAG: hypothetical protein NC204_06820, partial [Candidatus Amulumruptor caecigallinarius]|nr:hypothetical protein [Candidatus Amulumruptor caecigallinarius]
EVCARCRRLGLMVAGCFDSVAQAAEQALADARRAHNNSESAECDTGNQDVIFIGGSTFVVADYLAACEK